MLLTNLVPRYNIRPSNDVPALQQPSVSGMLVMRDIIFRKMFVSHDYFLSYIFRVTLSFLWLCFV